MSTTLPTLFGREVNAVHCAGVGGMGVGPLAVYLAQRGWRVSGEDDAMTDAMRAQLLRAGVVITGPGAIPSGCGLVACSSAIAGGHPAVAEANARGLPVVRRGELLAEVTRDRRQDDHDRDAGLGFSHGGLSGGLRARRAVCVRLHRPRLGRHE